jgi:hypothetical protein
VVFGPIPETLSRSAASLKTFASQPEEEIFFLYDTIASAFARPIPGSLTRLADVAALGFILSSRLKKSACGLENFPVAKNIDKNTLKQITTTKDVNLIEQWS